MKYFFVLGNNTTLSLAEIFSVLKIRKHQLLSPDFFLAEIDEDLSEENLISRLGGTIKAGRILAELPANIKGELEKEAKKILLAKKSQAADSKFNYGISVYGEKLVDSKKIGLSLKKNFQEQGISARFVVSREKTLSSVVVSQNKLLKKGLELIIAGDNNYWYLGETRAVQPFKDLSRRDYGRPARDDLSGMIPPKLAQIMINLAKLNDFSAKIADPFCGSGTILTEAMIMGYRSFCGSDISQKAVDDSYKNISWIKELYKIENLRLELKNRNVLALAKFIKAASLDAVITEPYLGPQRGRLDFASVISELEGLYTGAIRQFKEILKSGGRVVMVWPLFYGQREINPDYSGFKMIEVLPESFKKSRFVKENKRPTIIYGRPGQKVYREIVVLEKI
jgi:tRNA G10  N-methylase Trm11